MRRIRLRVRGVVQGVGFRPFVYALATRLGLAGFVLNEPDGVAIELEGQPDALDAFHAELGHRPPPLARIQAVDREEIEPEGAGEFVIRQSEEAGERTVFIAPDIATCPDCLREMNDPAGRRHRYPFINCTNCGPRYTIIRDVPYDRARTTMAAFAMCPECQAEYEDPANRRFHAEPTCCAVCGPRVELVDSAGAGLAAGDDAVAEAVRRLADGQVLAIKGLGGFHLACNAADAAAVARLRKRKARDLKPFAVMARDIAAVERFCLVPADAVATLTGAERPILLLDKRPGHPLAREVAPRSASFGVMLPYTPLHHLLLDGPFPALVMTSGNISDEPIAHTNDDALARLAPMADCFLLHNRHIHIRTDDSVVRRIAGQLRFLRRSRGYAPFPVPLPTGTDAGEILATGPELNDTVCLTRRGHAFLSH
ncbi:MAG: carbamoyltransferase HypF, partial [Candidatus Hydrogenedentes bacterium]|nr:carbamoyltransferase HypF [Candidatus Hydrogenedentota bacterium]